MYLYTILPTRKIPGAVLVYKSEQKLEVGRLVEAPIRNKPVEGVIVNTVDEKNLEFDISKVKKISNIKPFIFTQSEIEFIKSFAYNTFNSSNLVLKAKIQPLKLLTKKN